MSPAPDKPTRRRWPWAAVLLLVMYPLSAGPVQTAVFWAEYWLELDFETLKTIFDYVAIVYWPLNQLGDWFPAFGAAMDEYGRLWIPLYPEDW